MSRDSQSNVPMSWFDYHLPPELIAQHPVEPRDSSRLLIVSKHEKQVEDRIFRELPDILQPHDLLVLNDTRVIPARLFARRLTGGRVEFLLLSRIDGDTWRALARPARRLRPGELLQALDPNDNPANDEIQIMERELGGEFAIRIGNSDAVIHRIGQMPLPPYINERLEDPERYQTVFAETEGSAAAPTAGLHFTPALLQTCRDRGIEIQYVTLHVGLDTFQPVKVEDAREHEIHSEWFQVSGETVDALRRAKLDGRRVIAVGTTAARTLETLAGDLSSPGGRSGWTSIYITPPYDFRLVDGMITNFHLPRTTLLLMVSALAGEETIRHAYEHAIRERYRFYSFGDAMFIV